MSDDTSASPENAASAEPAPRVRRVSNPRPKKQAAAESPVPAKSEEPATPAPEAPSSGEWPEAETISEGSGSGDAKRNKRRRRKGKNNKGVREADAPVDNHEDQVIPVVVESSEPAPEAPDSAPAPAPAPTPAAKPQPQQQNPQHQQQRPQQHQRTPIDPQVLAKKAWKIFLAEVSEEGVSLINDNDARELSRRCFRLAEIFLDEQGRRLK